MDSARKLSGWVAICFAFLIPWVSFLAPRAAGLVVPVAATLLLATTLTHRGNWQNLRSPLWFAVAGVLIFLCLSVLWAPNQEIGWERFAKLALFLPLGTAFVMLVRWDAVDVDNRILIAILAGLALSVLLMGFHVTTQGGVYALLKSAAPSKEMFAVINRPSVVLVLCFSAGVLALKKLEQERLAIPLGAVLLGILFFSTSQSALFGAIVWLSTYLAFLMMPTIAHRLMLWGGALFILMHPILVIGVQQIDAERSIDHAESSVGARLDIWYAVAHKILESPVYGYGLEAARSITDWSVEFVYYNGNSMLHPHNGLLQVWLEFGVIGAGLVGVGWIWLSRSLLRVPGTALPAIAALLMTSLFVLTVSHGLWQSWWLWSLFGVSALTILVLRASKIPA